MINLEKQIIKAIVDRDLDTLNNLLQNKIILNIRNKKGWLALKWAFLRKDFGIIEIFFNAIKNNNIEFIYGVDAFTQMVIESNIDVLKFMLEFGVDINSTDHIGRSPLDIAKTIGNQEVINLLVKNGAK